jgi:hypothetical protein
MIHDLEQTSSEVRDQIAPTMFSIFDSLKKAGFNDAMAYNAMMQMCCVSNKSDTKESSSTSSVDVVARASILLLAKAIDTTDHFNKKQYIDEARRRVNDSTTFG